MNGRQYLLMSQKDSKIDRLFRNVRGVHYFDTDNRLPSFSSSSDNRSSTDSAQSRQAVIAMGDGM